MACLEEGRYHSTSCTFQNRYIYVFGGYHTEDFYTKVPYKVSRKHEKLVNVRSDCIEVYDTDLDQAFNPTTHSHNRKEYSFRQIYLNRDNINNVGNLICFPLIDPYYPYRETNEILITGGLFIGIMDVKSHIYNIDNHKVNVRKELQIPNPDISKFYYWTP